MMQQVNLYQPILRREKKVFSAVTMLQVLVIIIALMAGLYGYNVWQHDRLEQQLAALKEQERELVTRVATATRNLQARPESRELRQRVERARAERELKTRLIGVLDRRGEGPLASRGFAEAFAGLARQPVNGLWLTHIEMNQAGAARELVLHGRTARAELVPQLVQRLGNETVFSGVRFQHMQVTTPPDGGNTLVFELSTRVPEERRR
jgi:Tfp pilus assembly protein PilN